MAEVTIDDVATSVAQLREAVNGMKERTVDAETVERIATEVLERQTAQAREQRQREGYRPDEMDKDGKLVDDAAAEAAFRGMNARQRMEQIHQRSAAKVSPVVRATEEEIRRFQVRADELVLISSALGINPRETRYFETDYLPALRAMDTATATEGQEFVPRELSAALIERVNLDLMVAALFPVIQMPTNPFDIPGKSVARKRAGILPEATADSGQTKAKKITPNTRKVTLTAVKFAGEALVSKEAEEDAIIAMLPFITEDLTEYMAADLEDAILNGDTTATHMDSDVDDSDDPRKAWIGLRKATLAGAKNDGGNDALTVADLRANRLDMGKYGVRPQDLVHILSIKGYIQLLSDSNVLTVDKYGQNATILTGELGKVDNTPIVVSEYARQDLNASGVVDETTTNRHSAVTAHRRGFIRGERRGMTVQVLRELYAESDQDAILATTRQAFSARFPTGTEPIVAQTYNLGG